MGTSEARSKLAAPFFEADLAGFGFAPLRSKNFVVVGAQFDHRSKEASLKRRLKERKNQVRCDNAFCSLIRKSSELQ